MRPAKKASVAIMDLLPPNSGALCSCEEQPLGLACPGDIDGVTQKVTSLWVGKNETRPSEWAQRAPVSGGKQPGVQAMVTLGSGVLGRNHGAATVGAAHLA